MIHALEFVKDVGAQNVFTNLINFGVNSEIACIGNCYLYDQNDIFKDNGLHPIHKLDFYHTIEKSLGTFLPI